MWTHKTEPTDKPNTLKITISHHGNILRFDQVIDGWKNDADFRTFYIKLLADIPFPALFWETPPLTIATLNQPYEFIVADSLQLAAVAPDLLAFREHFQRAVDGQTVIAFENLGGDAMLIVPCPIASGGDYPHLAAFIRSAPDEQKHAFFQRLSVEISSRLSNQPLWISTSGLGIYWLHARLDEYPKYYTYAPYRIYK